MTTIDDPGVQSRGGSTRRRLLTRLSGLSAGFFAGAAALGADEAAAYPYACCGLSTDIVCAGCSTGVVTCPPGGTARYWYCCEAGRLYGCVECTPADVCWDGPWLCSCGFPAYGTCAT